MQTYFFHAEDSSVSKLPRFFNKSLVSALLFFTHWSDEFFCRKIFQTFVFLLELFWLGSNLIWNVGFYCDFVLSRWELFKLIMTNSQTWYKKKMFAPAINQNKTHWLNLQVKQAGKLEVENFALCTLNAEIFIYIQVRLFNTIILFCIQTIVILEPKV